MEKTPVYRTIYHSVYNEVAQQMDHAVANGSDFDKEDAFLILDNLFRSVYWQHHEGVNGILVSEYGCERYFQSWQHRSRYEEATDLAYLEIDPILYSGISDYLKHPEIQTGWLDWYCADVLTYYAYLEWVKFSIPITQVFTAIWIWQGGWSAFWGFLVRMFFWIIKWSIWAVVAVVAYLWNIWALLFLLVITVVCKYQKHRKNNTSRGLIEAAEGTYLVFRSETFSWTVALDHMKKVREFTREDWPGELYRLVESRSAAQRTRDQSD